MFKISEAAKRKCYQDVVRAQVERSKVLRSRLAAKAESDGPDSIWAEMLAEHDARHAAAGR